jgi:predicted ATP-dependent serine protease
MSNYAIQYIKKVTTGECGEPDKALAGSDYQTLEALYEARAISGIEGAQSAWLTLKRFVPHLDKKSRKLLANDLENLEVPKYAVGGYPIYERGFNILVGGRGSGKSFVALDVCAKIALEHPNRAVVYSAGEGLPSYAVRWKAWKQHHAQEPKNLLFWDGAVQLMKSDDYDQFLADFARDKPIFVVIDTVARAMTGYSENDTMSMSDFVARVDTMMHDLNCGVLLVHHEGRNGAMRGSTALDGAADSVIVLKRQESDILLLNDFSAGGKNRHQEEQPPKRYELYPVNVYLHGMLEQGAVVVPSEQIAHAPDEPLKGNELKVYEAIDAHGKANIQNLIDATQLARATVYRIATKLVATNRINQDSTTKEYVLSH